MKSSTRIRQQVHPTTDKRLQRVESAPDPLSPNSPKGGLLGLIGSNFLRRDGHGSRGDLAMASLMESAPVHPPSPPVQTHRRLGSSCSRALEEPDSPAKSALSMTSGLTSKTSVSSPGQYASDNFSDGESPNNSSSSLLSLGDQLQQLAKHSPTPKPMHLTSSFNRSFLSLDDASHGDDDDTERDEEDLMCAEKHLNTSIAALQSFQHIDSPSKSPRQRTTKSGAKKEFNSDSDESATRKKKKKEKKKLKAEKKERKAIQNSNSSSRLSTMASPDEKERRKLAVSSPSPSSVLPRPNPSYGSGSDLCISPGLHEDPSISPRRGRSPTRSPLGSLSHKRGVAPLSGRRPTRKLSHLVGKPYIPKIVNTMKADTLRIEQLTAQVKAVNERKKLELENIAKSRSEGMKKIQVELNAEFPGASVVSLPSKAELESNKRLADQLRRENAQIREHNQQMRTNCQNLRINNVRLEEKNVEMADYKKRLDAHYRRVSEEHDKLKAMHDQFEKDVKQLEEQVEEETNKATCAHLNRERFEQRSYELAEMVKLYDKDNKDLHRRIEAILTATDSQRQLWPASKVDRSDIKRQASGSRRASLRESL